MQADGQLTGIDRALKIAGNTPSAVLQAARKGLAAGLLLIAGRAQNSYLSGPRPQRLGVVTGRLRGSIATKTEVKGDDIIGTIGTAVPYGRFHELGFVGVQAVKAHTRILGIEHPRFNINLRLARGPIRERSPDGPGTGALVGYKRSSRKAAGQLIQQLPGSRVAYVNVKAYQRRLNYAGRPFLKPAIRDMEPQVRAIIIKNLATTAAL